MIRIDHASVHSTRIYMYVRRIFYSEYYREYFIIERIFYYFIKITVQLLSPSWIFARFLFSYKIPVETRGSFSA